MIYCRSTASLLSGAFLLAVAISTHGHVIVRVMDVECMPSSPIDCCPEPCKSVHNQAAFNECIHAIEPRCSIQVRTEVKVTQADVFDYFCANPDESVVQLKSLVEDSDVFFDGAALELNITGDCGLTSPGKPPARKRSGRPLVRTGIAPDPHECTTDSFAIDEIPKHFPNTASVAEARADNTTVLDDINESPSTETRTENDSANSRHNADGSSSVVGNASIEAPPLVFFDGRKVWFSAALNITTERPDVQVQLPVDYEGSVIQRAQRQQMTGYRVRGEETNGGSSGGFGEAPESQTPCRVPPLTERSLGQFSVITEERGLKQTGRIGSRSGSLRPSPNANDNSEMVTEHDNLKLRSTDADHLDDDDRKDSAAGNSNENFPNMLHVTPGYTAAPVNVASILKQLADRRSDNPVPEFQWSR